jgi:hypothetical protein
MSGALADTPGFRGVLSMVCASLNAQFSYKTAEVGRSQEQLHAVVLTTVPAVVDIPDQKTVLCS